MANRPTNIGAFLCGNLNEAHLNFDPVEVVTLFDVVEHFSDPMAALAECGQKTREDGMLLATTPNVGLKQDQGSRYYHYSPDHLVLFTAASLRSLAQRAGWTSVVVEDLGERLRSLDPGQEWYATRKYTNDRSHLLMVCRGFSDHGES